MCGNEIVGGVDQTECLRPQGLLYVRKRVLITALAPDLIPLTLLKKTTEASVGSKLTRSSLDSFFHEALFFETSLASPSPSCPSVSYFAGISPQSVTIPSSASRERVTHPRISITEHKRHNVEDSPHLDVEGVRGLIPEPHRHLHPGGISMGFFISKRAHDWLEEIILQCALIHHSCMKDHRASGAIEGFLDGLAKQGSRTAFLLASERKMRMIRSHL